VKLSSVWPLQIQAAAMDIFTDIIYPWIPSARNPCYWDPYNEVKCLPFLSILGVSKCGTTDLYWKLMRIKCESFLSESLHLAADAICL
jgi:hypothetical protein